MRRRSLTNESGKLLADGGTDKGMKYIHFDIRIKDSGYGIAPENLDKLFMNFSRLDEHSQLNTRGTGLGLSICKSLIELMGGSVSVESEMGKGTTFIMSLKTKCKFHCACFDEEEKVDKMLNNTVLQTGYAKALKGGKFPPKVGVSKTFKTPLNTKLASTPILPKRELPHLMQGSRQYKALVANDDCF